jgi:hypothetical protein
MRIIELLFFVLLPILSFSQKISISADKMDILYIGVDNPISIAIDNHNCDEIAVKSSNGNITGSNCHYKFYCEDTLLTKSSIIVGLIKDSIITWIDTFKFRLKLIPDPIVFNSNPKFNNRDIIHFFTNAGLIPVMKDFDFEVNFTINNYSIMILRNNSVIFQESGLKGNKITSEIDDFLVDKCKSGDIIFFYDIIAVGPDKIKRLLNNIKLNY